MEPMLVLSDGVLVLVCLIQIYGQVKVEDNIYVFKISKRSL